MGHALSAPITSKMCHRAGKWGVRVGGGEMQGFRLNMEDAHNVETGFGNYPDSIFIGVYDGHAGTEASKYLSENLVEAVGKLKNVEDVKELTDCVVQVDADFVESCGNDLQRRNHGSTCVFAVVTPNHTTEDAKRSWRLTVSNVGDSRVIIVRKNGDLVSLTTDHKPLDVDEKQRIEQAGGFVHMNRVDGQLAMSRAMGDYQYKANMNLGVLDQKVIPLPDITSDVIFPGDSLCVMCDGIVEQMTNEDAATYIHAELSKVDRKTLDPVDIMDGLVMEALRTGSKDNMSAYLAVFGEDDSYSENWPQQPAEFRAGRYAPYQRDDAFRKAYFEDAKKHGIEAEELLQLAAVVDADAPPSENEMAQSSDFNMPVHTQKQKLMALVSILQSQGGQGGQNFLDMDDDEDSLIG